MNVVEQLGDAVGIRTACEALGVSRATFYRSRRPKPAAPRKPVSQPRALNEKEREVVRATLNSERFMDQSPREVYATLLDENRYLCSIRTMYRILEADNASKERRAQLRHPEYKKPELLATGANQVWSWDITKLLGPEKWSYFYLYVILDIYSRYAVGWVLAHRESSDLASLLIQESVTKQQVSEEQLTIHSVDRLPPGAACVECDADTLALDAFIVAIEQAQTLDRGMVRGFATGQFDTDKIIDALISNLQRAVKGGNHCAGTTDEQGATQRTVWNGV